MSETKSQYPAALEHARHDRASSDDSVVPLLAGATAPSPDPATTARPPHEPAADPLTAWLLERHELTPNEFSLLFAIHKLGSRQRAAGWITRTELCRSTNLDQASLSATLRTLEEYGLLRIRRHSVKTGWARYVVVIE